MAARYWVGGTGNWSDAANHWSDTSGGAPGAGFLPTSADDVYFDANSLSITSTVTLNTNGVCLDLDFSGLDSILNFNNSAPGYSLTIYGSLTLSASNLTWNWTSVSNPTLVLAAIDGRTITSNGVTIYPRTMRIDGSGGTYTLQDDLLLPSTVVYLKNGTLDINGKTMQVNYFATETGVKTLSLSSGKLTLRVWYNISNLNFTFNSSGLVEVIPEDGRIEGVAEFTNLTIQNPIAANSTIRVSLTTNVVVTNEFKCLGYNDTGRRILICSEFNTWGTVRTITAANVEVESTNFAYINGAGAGSWDLSAIVGYSGDCGGNTNIIFTAPKNCYWYSNNGSYSDKSKWFTATNGGGTSNIFPLPQDDAIIDENSFSSDGTIIMDCSFLGNFDARDIDQNVTIDFVNNFRQIFLFKSFYLSSLITLYRQTNAVYVHGLGNQYLDLKSKAIAFLWMRMKTGSYVLLSDCVVTGTVIKYDGDFDLNSYNLTAGAISHYAGKFYLRTGTILLNATSGYLWYNSSNQLYTNESTIRLNPQSGVQCMFYNGQINTYNKVIIDGVAGSIAGIYSDTSTLIFNEFEIKPGKTVEFQGFRTFRFYKFIANGTIGSIITIKKRTADIQAHNLINLSTTDFIVTYCDISWSSVTGTLKIKTVLGKAWANMSKTIGIVKASIKKIMGIYVNSAWIATNSTDSGNNTGWNITS